MDPGPNVTKRLAARNLDPEKIQPRWLLRIVETIIEKKIVSVKTCLSKKKELVHVIEFSEREDAKRIYDFCDGLLIEDTRELFDLSFVPDSVDFGAPLDECRDSAGFCYQKPSRAKIDYTDLLGPGSDEEGDASEEKGAGKAANAKKGEPKTKPINLQDALDNEDEADDLEGFKFDMADERFSRIFTDHDFVLDASNKRFREQRESAEILSEMRKSHEETGG